MDQRQVRRKASGRVVGAAAYIGGVRVHVAASAGLANALFARGCVIEILPANFSAAWLRDLCFQVGCEWRGWFAPSPLADWRAWRYRLRPNFRFAWRLRLSAFLPWLDGELRALS
jgi:capsular polysaccharide biosynthesis protein